VPFTISLHRKSVPCPDRIVYASNEPIDVSWTVPVIDFRSSAFDLQALVPSIEPRSEFQVGETWVQYDIVWSGSPQDDSLLVSCKFPVSITCVDLPRL
jgi:hypothetical protein